MVLTQHQLSVYFGIFGNVVSFMVFMAPLPTFYRIYRKKSTEGFQSIPYSVSLFSAMIYLYYALMKANMISVVSINAVGIVIQGAYLVIFMIYATREAKCYTWKLLIGFNFLFYGAIVVSVSSFVHNHETRVTIVGWICSVFSVCVFASPLSIMMKVIRTKSVEFMPISLSFALTLCAVIWFIFGYLVHDYYIAAPNILGFVFGIAQMLLYVIYMRAKQVLPEDNLKEIEAAAKTGDGFEVNLKEINGEEAAAKETVIQVEVICDAQNRV